MNLTGDVNGVFGWARPDRPMQLNPGHTPDVDKAPFMLKALEN